LVAAKTALVGPRIDRTAGREKLGELSFLRSFFQRTEEDAQSARDEAQREYIKVRIKVSAASLMPAFANGDGPPIFDTPALTTSPRK